MYGIYDGGSVIAKFVAPTTVRSNHPVFASDTLSLSRNATRRVAQRWEIQTHLEPLSNSAQDLFVHLIDKAYTTAFTILMPQNYGAKLARSTTSPTPLASGVAGNTIVTLTGNTQGYIPKGTFIKFSNHNKIYLAMSNRSGDGTLSIYPALKTTMLVQNNISMTWRDDVLMQCLYDLDVVTGMVYSDGILMDMGEIRLVEAV